MGKTYTIKEGNFQAKAKQYVASMVRLLDAHGLDTIVHEKNIGKLLSPDTDPRKELADLRRLNPLIEIVYDQIKDIAKMDLRARDVTSFDPGSAYFPEKEFLKTMADLKSVNIFERGNFDQKFDDQCIFRPIDLVHTTFATVRGNEPHHLPHKATQLSKFITDCSDKKPGIKNMVGDFITLAQSTIKKLVENFRKDNKTALQPKDVVKPEAPEKIVEAAKNDEIKTVVIEQQPVAKDPPQKIKKAPEEEKYMKIEFTDEEKAKLPEYLYGSAWEASIRKREAEVAARLNQKTEPVEPTIVETHEQTVAGIALPPAGHILERLIEVSEKRPPDKAEETNKIKPENNITDSSNKKKVIKNDLTNFLNT